MVPPSFNLKQRLAALSLAQSSPSSPDDAKYQQARNLDSRDFSHPPPITPNGKRKFFSTPNWVKKAQEEGGAFNRERDIEPAYRDEEKRLVQDVMSKMIFQAGVDFEYVLFCCLNPPDVFYFMFTDSETFMPGRDRCKTDQHSVLTPCVISCRLISGLRVVFNASALPDPQLVPYDLLLAYVSPPTFQ